MPFDPAMLPFIPLPTRPSADPRISLGSAPSTSMAGALSLTVTAKVIGSCIRSDRAAVIGSRRVRSMVSRAKPDGAAIRAVVPIMPTRSVIESQARWWEVNEDDRSETTCCQTFLRSA